jgi:chemotaxis family two-component system sensor kinase Cph1
MLADSRSQPEFGQANLSNCEREQIHLAASIQPHGILLVLREHDWVVVQSSENAAMHLGVETILNRPVDALGGDLSEALARYIGEPLHDLPRAVRCRVGPSLDAWNVLIHRAEGGGIVVELERAATPVDVSPHIRRGIERMTACSSLPTLCAEAAAIYKELTGYDRVMAYRFDDQGHGEIVAEEREVHLEAYLCNHYPATDIPQMARRLYERNRVRVLVDVNYKPVPLQPRLTPLTGADLDMSLCFLRSMSPIHIQYLKNMGVVATLVMSIVVEGRLWGLIACHHYASRSIPYETRTACELLAEIMATRISALQSFAVAQAEVSVRRLEHRMGEAISRHGSWQAALFDTPQSLLAPTAADGAALLFEGETFTTGEVPNTAQLRDIRDWLDARPRSPLYATARLALDEPRFVPLQPIASGLLAVPISAAQGEYLLWFRTERVRTITWGGDPSKAVVAGASPEDLSPRRSFEQWRQLVEGTCEPWSGPDLAAARSIGAAVADFVLQFRSVRMLVALDQLERVRAKLLQAAQPVVVADPTGRVSLLSDALEKLLPANHAPIRWLDDLAPAFDEPEDARMKLRAALKRANRWVGEMKIRTPIGDARRVLARADPVLSSSGITVGIVINFTDLSEQCSTERARQRFHERMIDARRRGAPRLDTAGDLVERDLLAQIVANAQLAALEIPDGAGAESVAGTLEHLRASVGRASRLLRHLTEHALGRPSNSQEVG